jgi:hypothetical protein
MTLPKARAEKLTVRELPEETLVYDHERKKAHCLNRTAALVWRHCDGETSLEALEPLVQEALHIKDAGAVIRLALHQLARRNLLEQDAPPLAIHERLSRRDALKKLAFVALPIVITITATGATQMFTNFSQCQGAGNGNTCSFTGQTGIGPIPFGSPPGICCSSTCVNPKTDASNCGSCGHACPNGQMCFNGVCGGPVATCSGVANNTPCGAAGAVTGKCCNGNCLTSGAFTSDPQNCGSCGHACGSGQVCFMGNCVACIGFEMACTPGTGIPCCGSMTCQFVAGLGFACM